MSPELEDIVGEADELPFSFHLLETSQKKSSDTPILFDLSENRFYAFLPFGIGLQTRFCLELAQCSVHHGQVVGNTPTGSGRWFIGVFGPFTRDKRFHETLKDRFHVSLTEISRVSQHPVRDLAKDFLYLLHHRDQLLFVIGLLSNINAHNHLTGAVHRDLTIVSLHKRLGRPVFHDPTVRISEVSLFLRLRLDFRDLRSSAGAVFRRFSILATVTLPGSLPASLFFQRSSGLSDLLQTLFFESQFLG